MEKISEYRKIVDIKFIPLSENDNIIDSKKKDLLEVLNWWGNKYWVRYVNPETPKKEKEVMLNSFKQILPLLDSLDGASPHGKYIIKLNHNVIGSIGFEKENCYFTSKWNALEVKVKEKSLVDSMCYFDDFIGQFICADENGMVTVLKVR